MKEIKLTQNKVALVDDRDYEYLNQYKWYPNVRKRSTYAMRTFWIDGKCKTVYMHRELLGLTDSNIQVDHINNNGLDNQRSNLRICNRNQNNQNRRSALNSTSKYLGVYITIDKRWGSKAYTYWRAAIKENGKVKYLGNFKTEIEAASAYNNAAQKIHGAFANLNVL